MHYILIACFLALGSGLVRAFHDASHAQADRAALVATTGSHDPANPDQPRPQHDETNCFIHAQLSTPLTIVAWVPLLILLGLLVAFLSLLAPQPVEAAFCLRLSCRGPPAAC